MTRLCGTVYTAFPSSSAGNEPKLIANIMTEIKSAGYVNIKSGLIGNVRSVQLIIHFVR